jgi:hypothetical protein
MAKKTKKGLTTRLNIPGLTERPLLDQPWACTKVELLPALAKRLSRSLVLSYCRASTWAPT